MHMVGHHFHLDKGLPPTFHELCKQLLESRVNSIDQHAAPVLGAKHNMIVAIVNDIPVALNYCLHAQSILQDSRYVSRNYWPGFPIPRPKQGTALLSPCLKDKGFYAPD